MKHEGRWTIELDFDPDTSWSARLVHRGEDGLLASDPLIEVSGNSSHEAVHWLYQEMWTPEVIDEMEHIEHGGNHCHRCGQEDESIRYGECCDCEAARVWGVPQ